ncbi:hypothetical protein BpHYR1_050316 [Brachionus plicatilis]|uniref:RNA-directed DNA polymerase from mobile element jockey-like n=1 Tax=Brachionus plicatilis TaxID=10195 RepID=A0A3M7SDB2_BRAPC|nr:hypothetical protein BpHYR1_050316 [Brachionus plicatilis]
MLKNGFSNGKLKFLLKSHKKTVKINLDLKIYDSNLNEEDKVKLLGITVDSKLTFSPMVNDLKERWSKIKTLVRNQVRAGLSNFVPLVVRLVEEYREGLESRYIEYKTPLCNCCQFFIKSNDLKRLQNYFLFYFFFAQVWLDQKNLILYCSEIYLSRLTRAEMKPSFQPAFYFAFLVINLIFHHDHFRTFNLSSELKSKLNDCYGNDRLDSKLTCKDKCTSKDVFQYTPTTISKIFSIFWSKSTTDSNRHNI